MYFHAVVHKVYLLQSNTCVILFNVDLKDDELVELVTSAVGKNKNLKIALGNSYKSILLVNQSFVQAKNALEYVESNSLSDTVTRYANMEMQVSNIQLTGFNEEIQELLENNDVDGVYDKLDDMLSMFHSGEGKSVDAVSYEAFRYVMYRIIAAFLEIADSINLENRNELEEIANELMTEADVPYGFAKQQLSKMVQILSEFFSKVSKQNEQNKDNKENDNQLLEQINQVIDEHMCDQMLSLDMLANSCDVSTSYLGRYFKEKTGTTPMRYVSDQRMKFVKQKLRETDMTLNEIVSRSGYIDVSNFIRKFRQETGMTPIDYREMHQKDM